MLTDQGYVQRIEATFKDLGKYGQRLRTPHYSAPGSDLAKDDTDWPPLSVSQLAWGCFAAAFDHLDLVRLTIEQKRSYATATYSVMRGALLGACQAAWLLGPDDAECRRERARIFGNEWYVNRIKWQEGLTPDLTVDDAARSATQLNRLETDQKALAAKRSTKAKFNSTANVAWVGKHYFGDKASLQRSLMSQWRRLGGDAHALGWTFMTQSKVWDTTVTTADGLTPALVSSSFSDIAEGYLASWYVNLVAWRRFDALNMAN